MNDTEEVTILSDGPQVAAKTLEPIGILDRSEAWGLWIPDLGEPRKDHADHIPHLLISAIPPASWPLAFQLQAYISDENSSLQRLTEVLKEASVDMIFAECGPAGHHHAALNAICVARGLEAGLKVVLGSKEQALPTDRQKRITFRRLGLLMLKFLTRLEADLFDRHSSRGPQFLYAGGVDVDTKRKRCRFSRRRTPWRLAPKWLLRDGQWAAGFTRRQVESAFLDCIKTKQPANASCDPTEWEGFAKSIVKETKWWTGSARERKRGVPHEDDNTNRAAVSRLENLTSDHRGDSFQFYRAWRHHTFDVVRLRALERLSYFWLFSDQRSSPIAFEYVERQQVLRALNGREFENAVSDVGEGRVILPARSVVAIDRTERFLRFCLFERLQAERNLVLVDLPYTARRADPTLAPVSTTGLLNDLLGVIAGAAPDSSLRRVSNRLIDRSDAKEQGRVRIVLDLKPADPLGDPDTVAKVLKLDGAIKAFNARRAGDRDLQLGKELKVVRYPARRVFISMPQRFPRRRDVGHLLRSLCEARGLEAVIIGDDRDYATEGLHQTAVTELILKEIRDSDGFLQLLTLRADERQALSRNEPVHPNYGWLAYEYGVADERNLGPIRVVDISMPPGVRQAFGVRRDNPDLEFDMNAADEVLREQLRDAVEKVEAWVYRRPPRSATVK